MRQKAIYTAILVSLALAAAGAWADDVSEADEMLCTPVQVTQCFPDGDCVIAPPWELNIPQFIVVDLEARKLSTTEASGQNRSTPIKNLEREDGFITLQGVENGRAFSFMIAEDNGMLTAAVARDGLAVSVFGACTPLPSGE